MPAANYVIRRKVFSFLGGQFHIYNAEGALIGYSKQKAFKLKEDIRVYTDESMQKEVLTIKARQIIDFGAGYDVVDSRAQQKIGALKRKGWTSILRDSWIVMDENDAEIGKIEEDSLALAMLRRFVAAIPQRYHLADGQNQKLAFFHQNWNPFVFRLAVGVEEHCSLNPLLVLAAGILLVAVEGREK
jgi:uncharacterized protein YxjI